MVVLILLGIVGVISIVYAALSTTLYIQSGNDTKVEPRDIQFDNVGSGSARPFVAGNELINGYLVKNLDDLFEYEPGQYMDATGGIVTISETDKINDTATISGTKLHYYSSVIKYKLNVKNMTNKQAKLQSATSINIVNNNVEIGLYKDLAYTTPVAAGDTLAASGNQDWYVKVSHKPAGPGVVLEENPFTFSITSIWQDATA